MSRSGRRGARDPGRAVGEPRPAPPRDADAAAPAAAAARAAAGVLAALLALALARGALPFTPGMWAWSLNLQRFLAPGWAWGPWALLALSLVPAVARLGLPALERSGDWIARHPRRAAWLAAVVTGGLALGLPDQVRFTGDFLIRQGTVEAAILPQRVWPQAMPLDALLHFALPFELTRLGAADANAAARALGALEAAGLGALAIGFAAALRLEGAAVWSAAGLALGGFLGLFTGYGKAFTEMALLTAAIAVAGLAAIRTGRGLLPMSLAFSLALAVHRSAIGLLPAVLIGGWLWARRFGGREAWGSWRTRAAAAIPLIGLAAFLPRIVHLAATVDPVHFASAEIAARGGLLASALSMPRLVDSKNVLLLLAPLAPLAPLAALGLGRGLPRGREAAFLALLAAPFVLSIPFVHALGGLFRDVDDFAAAGVATAALAAWLLAETLRGAPRHRWLAVPALLAAAVPTLQWMVHQTDLERGVRRVEALVAGPPPRTESEQARTWDYVGTRWNQLGRLEASAEAFRRASLAGPSPRMLQQWAIAEELRGNLAVSLDVYRRLVAKDSSNASAWSGMAQVASRIPDRAELRRALTQLLRLRPGDAEAARVLRALDAETARPPGADARPGGDRRRQ